MMKKNLLMWMMVTCLVGMTSGMVQAGGHPADPSLFVHDAMRDVVAPHTTLVMTSQHTLANDLFVDNLTNTFFDVFFDGYWSDYLTPNYYGYLYVPFDYDTVELFSYGRSYYYELSSNYGYLYDFGTDAYFYGLYGAGAAYLLIY